MIFEIGLFISCVFGVFLTTGNLCPIEIIKYLYFVFVGVMIFMIAFFSLVDFSKKEEHPINHDEESENQVATTK